METINTTTRTYLVRIQELVQGVLAGGKLYRVKKDDGEDGVWEHVTDTFGLCMYDLANYDYRIEKPSYRIWDISFPAIGRIVKRKDSQDRYIVISQTVYGVTLGNHPAITYQELYEQYVVEEFNGNYPPCAVIEFNPIDKS